MFFGFFRFSSCAICTLKYLELFFFILILMCSLWYIEITFIIFYIKQIWYNYTLYSLKYLHNKSTMSNVCMSYTQGPADFVKLSKIYILSTSHVNIVVKTYFFNIKYLFITFFSVSSRFSSTVPVLIDLITTGDLDCLLVEFKRLASNSLQQFVILCYSLQQSVIVCYSLQQSAIVCYNL